jgi:hypothetical protein
VGQRSQPYPDCVPAGPVHCPPLAVSVEPTCGVPETVGGAVTAAAGVASAGHARTQPTAAAASAALTVTLIEPADDTPNLAHIFHREAASFNSG